MFLIHVISFKFTRNLQSRSQFVLHIQHFKITLNTFYNDNYMKLKSLIVFGILKSSIPKLSTIFENQSKTCKLRYNLWGNFLNIIINRWHTVINRQYSAIIAIL